MIVKGETIPVDVTMRLDVDFNGLAPQECLTELGQVLAARALGPQFVHRHQIEVKKVQAEATLTPEFDPVKIVNDVLTNDRLTADDRIEGLMVLAELALQATCCNDDEAAYPIVDSALERLSPNRDPDFVEQWIPTTLEY